MWFLPSSVLLAHGKEKVEAESIWERGLLGEYTGRTGCKEPDIWEVRVTVMGREGQEGKVRRRPTGHKEGGMLSWVQALGPGHRKL